MIIFIEIDVPTEISLARVIADARRGPRVLVHRFNLLLQNGRHCDPRLAALVAPRCRPGPARLRARHGA